MELSDSFEVDCPIGRAWAVLTDVERIAPCLPGAQLTDVSGGEYQGTVKVKVGPITSQYKGTATFLERDDAEYRIVLSASGRDTRGAGNASAAIAAQLESVDESTTRVNVHTNLTVTGKVAQFGRGVMADVSKKLMAQFANNLADLIAADESARAEGTDGQSAGADGGDAEAPPPSDPPPAASAADEVEAVDLLAVAGAPMIKRLLPVLAVLVVVVVVVVVLAA